MLTHIHMYVQVTPSYMATLLCRYHRLHVYNLRPVCLTHCYRVWQHAYGFLIQLDIYPTPTVECLSSVQLLNAMPTKCCILLRPYCRRRLPFKGIVITFEALTSIASYMMVNSCVLPGSSEDVSCSLDSLRPSGELHVLDIHLHRKRRLNKALCDVVTCTYRAGLLELSGMILFGKTTEGVWVWWRILATG